MLKKGTTVNGDCSRVCDMCRSAACTVYCRADSAYLCSGCDARIHAANRVASRHERVWVCEACERAPAAFLCKADAASLCSSCDADIHSANPLANRHHCVPVLPISGFIGNGCEVEEKNDDEAEAASWLLLNPVKNDDNNKSNGFLFGEKYLDLVDCNSCGDNQFSIVDHHQQHNYCSVPQKSFAEDSVVPVQMQHQQAQHFQQGLKFDSSKASLSYNGSINQSMPSYLTPSDRESRILRYREKKKTRNFEKKIRYASRKAYAETRPRIKGRFAKRTDVEVEVDQMFSSTLMTEAGYSVVPSF